MRDSTKDMQFSKKKANKKSMIPKKSPFLLENELKNVV